MTTLRLSRLTGLKPAEINDAVKRGAPTDDLAAFVDFWIADRLKKRT